MASIRAQIIDDLLAALNVSGRPSGIPAAERLRLEQFDDADLPAIAVYPKSDFVMPATSRGGPVNKRELVVAIECRAGGDTAEADLDELVVWVSQALYSTDSTLIHDALEASTTFNFDLGRVLHGQAVVLVTIHYQAARSSQDRVS